MSTTGQQLIEDARFQQILNLQGLQIQQFFEQSPASPLFYQAQTYPQFFKQNLVSPNRILKKLLNNPQSNIRIFYFQVLRLGYEIQTQNDINHNVILNFKRIVFHPDFEILFTQQTENQRDLFNDFQFKKLFAEFIVFLDKQQYPNIEEILYHYPIMDTIFIHILRSLLASQNINQEFDIKIPSEVVFGELSLLFQLSVTSYGNCWKFQDSDMFCYEENQDQLYLAFIVEDGETEHSEGVNYHQQQREQREQIQYPNNPNNSPSHLLQIPQNHNQHIQPHLYPQAPRVPTHSPSQSTKNIQKSSTSMVSQNYEFTDYLGNTTTQKHKIPHVKDQPALSKNYDGFLSKVENTIKSSFSYPQPIMDNSPVVQNSNPIPINNPPLLTTNNHNYQNRSYGYETSSSYNPSLLSTNSYGNKSSDFDYLSYSGYNQNQKSSNYCSYESSYPNTYGSSSNYSQTYNSSYHKPYNQSYNQSHYPSSSYNTNSYSSYQNNSVYDKYGSSSNSYYQSSYKPVEYIPSTIYKPELVPAFKPVEPTPLPNFDNYKSPYQPKKDYSRIATPSYQPTYTYNVPSYNSSSYSSTIFQNNDFTSSSYKPAPIIQYNADRGDYYKDFTPPDILSKLRVQNRQNISKIRQSMKGVTRGGDLPTTLNLKRSAIYDNNSSSEPKPDLYRNQSRSQFEYPQIYKTVSSKPFDSNDFNYNSSIGKPYYSRDNYYQSIYSNSLY